MRDVGLIVADGDGAVASSSLGIYNMDGARAADEAGNSTPSGRCVVHGLHMHAVPAVVQAKSNKQKAVMLRARGHDYSTRDLYQLPTKTHDVLILIRGKPRARKRCQKYAECRLAVLPCTVYPAG